MHKRHFLKTAAAAMALCAAAGSAHAADTPIKFQLDWRFEGPSALFLQPIAKGYFQQQGLDVKLDAGNGSGAVVARIASGSYDMGLADMASLMEFYANHPEVPHKPVAVMVVYNNTPAAVMALKKSGIRSAADLNGKKLGAPVFDAGRKAFPIFAKANQVTNVAWTAMDPPLRETMLMRGDVDAITGFTFTSLLNLEARGAKPEDVTVLQYAEHGVKHYGNVIITHPQLLKDKPEAVKKFLTAFAQGAQEVIAKPADAVPFIKARDGIINSALEARRLQLAIDTVINTADARAEGFGRLDPARLARMATEVSEAFGTKHPVPVDQVWSDAFLPDAAVLDRVLPR